MHPVENACAVPMPALDLMFIRTNQHIYAAGTRTTVDAACYLHSTGYLLEPRNSTELPEQDAETMLKL